MNRVLAGLLLLACTGSHGASPAPVEARVPAFTGPTLPGLEAALELPPLTLFVRDGRMRNYFLRQGPAAAHLSTRSGSAPRVIVAFPAGNQGIGIWFSDAAADTELWAGAAESPGAQADVLSGATRAEAGRRFAGVHTLLRSNARTLTASLVLLGNVRTLRDYGYGVCLENRSEFPSLRNEIMDFDRARGILRVRRQQIGGEFTLELSLRSGANTQLALRDGFMTRPGCLHGSASTQPVIEVSAASTIELELFALSNEVPLTPIAREDLVRLDQDSRELSALQFLSYEEKLLAGSWRFLSYFGRDTLLSVRLLLPVLKSHAVEAALGSVLDRVNLVAGARDSSQGLAIELGEVAHEEEIGDYAAWRNSSVKPTPADLRSPRYDYKMIDADFLLAPVLAEYIEQLVALRGPDAGPEIEAFFQRRRRDGKSFRDALEANLALVLARAEPFAADPSKPLAKKQKLVSLKPGIAVGQWRDSEMGLAYGRYPYDVNVALVPAALASAASLYDRLAEPARATEARRLGERWSGVEELFQVELPIGRARANVAAYAAALGIADTSSSLQAESGATYRYAAIALDAQARPIPVLHSDPGFVLEFTKPSDASLSRIARTLGADFPAGLLSPAGMLVANPGLAAPEALVQSRTAEEHRLRALFTNSHYHGTVVWSWQQALFASGLRRQLQRSDLSPSTRKQLTELECRLWDRIEATKTTQAAELWSWQPDAKRRLEPRAFGLDRGDSDESNAIQLWSTVYLAVKRPAARCGTP